MTSIMLDNQDIEYWYRHEEIYTAPPVDEWERSIGEGGVIIHLRKFRVKHHTPKGVWLDLYGDREVQRFVLKDARKRYACPTLEEAQVSFLARKKRQLTIYEARAKGIRKTIEKAEQEFSLLGGEHDRSNRINPKISSD